MSTFFFLVFPKLLCCTLREIKHISWSWMFWTDGRTALHLRPSCHISIWPYDPTCNRQQEEDKFIRYFRLAAKLFTASIETA